MSIDICVCASGKAFKLCCKPLLDRVKAARTPQQLMRSRFSAFALGGYGDYLLDTWLPNKRVGLNAAELSQRSINWQHLEIIAKSQSGEDAVVEFKATFLDQNGEQHVHHEVSQFLRQAGRWFYVDGVVN